MIHDEEFTAMLAKADVGTAVLGWTDSEADGPTLESLIAAQPDGDVDAARDATAGS